MVNYTKLLRLQQPFIKEFYIHLAKMTRENTFLARSIHGTGIFTYIWLILMVNVDGPQTPNTCQK